MSASSFEEPARWSLAKRIAFRFAFSYLVLYNFPFPFDYVPLLYPLVGWHEKLLATLIYRPVSEQLFGIPFVLRSNGSGDQAAAYVRVLCLLLVAIVVTVLWSILDRRRAHYARLHEWLRVYIRFALAFIMLAYGVVKLLPSQFPPPTLDRLLQPFGDASPMGLLWTLMGSSPMYSFFGGVGETLGGLLLLFRRTTLLGALVSFGVMMNVLVLNFGYDVPVKLFTLHIVAMSVFLVLPDLRRLLDFFVLHREPDLLPSKRLRIAGIAICTVFTLYVLYTMVGETPTAIPRSPLYGIWNADTIVINGVTPAPNDPARWRRVVFDSPRWLALQTMDDSRTRFSLKLDQKKKTMEVEKRDEVNAKSILHYQQPDPNTIVLDGVIDKKNVHAVLHKAPIPTFRLTTRGFHWINESPYNR